MREPVPALQPAQVTFEIAAEHASLSVPIIAPDDNVGEIIAALRGRQFASATHLAVCEGEQFRGVLRIEDLLAAAEDACAWELMDDQPPVVAPGVDQEVATWQAVQHQESALAVVDAAGRFAGFIPPPRLLEVLLWEHEEDLSRLGGYLANTVIARTSAQEPVLRRFWHRIPWLFLGLVGAFVAADIVARFETRLQEQVVLAFFVPGIVYLADAVGTQTETVVVRGLSVGVPIHEVIWREMVTGLVIGLVLALITLPVIAWRWADPALALGVALSLFVAAAIASAVAMLLPWLLNRLNIDPAFGSGPLATVIQDLLSIMIYFTITAWIVG